MVIPCQKINDENTESLQIQAWPLSIKYGIPLWKILSFPYLLGNIE
jgi:hypothetical protein